MGKLLGTLVVVVLKAKNLPNKQRIGKQDAYATVIYRGQRNKTQVVRKAGQHPVFDDEFRYEVREDLDEEVHAEITASGGVKPAQEGKKPPKGRILKVTVYSDDPRDPIFIGDAHVDFEETMKKGEFDEWITLNDQQKKYAGEVFIEMTYYDQTRKAAPRPRSGADEFGTLQAGLRPGGGSHDALRASSMGSPNPQLRASTSYHRLSSAGIEPYAPNYASGLIPPGREGSPSASIGRSPLGGPPRHNSLNDAEIAAFSASMNASSMGRKPLPLPGSAPRPSVNSANLPASFHSHRLSLPTFEGVTGPQRTSSFEPSLPAQPEASTSAIQLPPLHPARPAPLPNVPSELPSGIEGWRNRVHSETHAPDAATLPGHAGYHSPPPSSTSMSSISQASYHPSMGPSVAQRHSPSPRPFPPLAAPSLPPGAMPGPRSAPAAPLTHEALYSHVGAMTLADTAPPMPARYNDAHIEEPWRQQQSAYSQASQPQMQAIPSRIPPGYVPGPPPPGFRAPPSNLPRPPSQNLPPVHPALSQPAQRPFETTAYPPPNGYLPYDSGSSPTLQSSPVQGEMQSQPNGTRPMLPQQPASAPSLYRPGATISGMASSEQLPPRPPEQMRPQASAPNLRAASPSLPGAYQYSPTGLEPMQNGQPRYSSAQYPPEVPAVPPTLRASSYGGPVSNEQPSPGLIRPLPVRPPEQQQQPKLAYVASPPQSQMYHTYEPPRRS